MDENSKSSGIFQIYKTFLYKIISNKRIRLIVLCLLFSAMGMYIGKTIMSILKPTNLYVPKLKVIGDVKQVIAVKDLEYFKGLDKKSIELQNLIHMAKPFSESYDVLLVGGDGLFAKLEGKNADDCLIEFSPDNGWKAVTEKHPVNSGIKNIKEIVIVSKEKSWDYGLNIISPKENILNITPGEFHLKESTLYPYFDGESSKGADKRDYSVKVYKYKRLLPLRDIVKSNGDPILMMGAKGIYELIHNPGYLEAVGNKINYIDRENRRQLQDIKGIMVDFPPHSIMDVYHDSLHYIENNERVLIILLDGFSYRQYRYGLTRGYMPFLEGIAEPKMATSVYKPITNGGFAAIITGQPPRVNGVYDRKHRDLKTESIFGRVEKMGKKSVLVEGDIKILNTEIEPILNIDRNENGTRDDEIFETALEAMSNEPDLQLVHFHSIDDMGHKYGDTAKETMEALKTIDRYIGDLVANWEGKIIITSDHGMHSTSQGGSHGAFRYEDMIVPYFFLEGGEK